jgi:hypothetical protein
MWWLHRKLRKARGLDDEDIPEWAAQAADEWNMLRH